MLNDLFPSIIDTKFLALFKMDDATGKVASQEATSFRSTVLGDLYKEVVRRRSTRAAPRGPLYGMGGVAEYFLILTCTQY